MSGSGDGDNAAFTIAGDELRTAAVLDFETKPRRFGAGPGHGRQRQLRSRRRSTITVTDVAETVNSAPTDVSLTPATVAENAPSATTVGTLSASDLDGGQAHTFALVAGAGDGDNGAFTVARRSALDARRRSTSKSRSSLSIRVATTDAAGATFAKALTVTRGRRQRGADRRWRSSNPEVAENEPAGTAVGTLAAEDVDLGQGHGFTLVSGAGDADNASFAIEGSTLETAEAFDFETKDTYSIRVRATDDGTPPMSVERHVHDHGDRRGRAAGGRRQDGDDGRGQPGDRHAVGERSRGRRRCELHARAR